ncbi:MAG TPA: hypothetical protein VKY26_06885, partial [Actinomycetota bacterium]|nr:hypothetical protein [Actinomycetota bacterium]
YGWPAGTAGWPPQTKPKVSAVNWIFGGIGVVAVLVSVVLLATLFIHPARHPSTGSAAPIGAAAPAGFTAYSDPTDGFSISVPSAWEQINPNSPGATEALNAFASANPSFRAIFSNASIMADFRLVALSNDSQGGIDVISKPEPGISDSDVTSGLGEIASTYQTMGITVSNTETLSLAGHRVGEIQGSLNFTGPTGARMSMPVTQYLIAAKDNVYIVTMFGSSSEFPAILQTFTLS